MLFLSIDTSGKSGGLTLAEGDENKFRNIETVPIAGGTFSAQLVPTLASILRKHGFVPGDLGGFVAVSGPGSFTGLRVGLSAIKGLAEVLQQRIVAVSLLEVMAVSFGSKGKVAVALDAGRGEVYFGLYQAGGGGAMIAEELLSQTEFINAIEREKPDHTITSDLTIVQLAAIAGIAAQHTKRPGSEAAARIGLQKLVAGDTIGVEELDANYIRRSDAEIFSSKQRVADASAPDREQF